MSNSSSDRPVDASVFSRCLMDCGWSDWRFLKFLGQGGHSQAALVEKKSAQDHQTAVLLLAPGYSPHYPVFEHYQSGARIREFCLSLGLSVPKTLAGPLRWGDGAVVLLSQIPGRDLDDLVKEKAPLNGRLLGQTVARLVEKSQALTSAHPNHSLGAGLHFYGAAPPCATLMASHIDWVSPLRGHDTQIDQALGHLQNVAQDLLQDVGCTTMLWDVGDRNVMIESGEVMGLVDQTNIYTGDRLFVPGFCLAMLSDVLGWSQANHYEEAWRQAWNVSEKEWRRVEVHRLASSGRQFGKDWHRYGNPGPSLPIWVERVRGLEG